MRSAPGCVGSPKKLSVPHLVQYPRPVWPAARRCGFPSAQFQTVCGSRCGCNKLLCSGRDRYAARNQASSFFLFQSEWPWQAQENASGHRTCGDAFRPQDRAGGCCRPVPAQPNPVLPRLPPGARRKLRPASAGYRLEQACESLAHPGALAKEVAYAVGFNDLSYFTWAFKRQLGLTPSEYRAGAR